MSTPRVTTDTLKLAVEEDLRATLVSSWYDVDYPGTLRRLKAELPDLPSTFAARTRQFFERGSSWENQKEKVSVIPGLTDPGPYRAVRGDLLLSLDMREMTYGWPTEMTVKAARCGARIVETPVSWRVRQAGRSKVSGTLRGTILAAWYILAVTLLYAWGKKNSYECER